MFKSLKAAKKRDAFDLWHALESISVLSSKLLWTIECALHYLKMLFAKQPNLELLDFPRLGTIIRWMDVSTISRTYSKDIMKPLRVVTSDLFKACKTFSLKSSDACQPRLISDFIHLRARDPNRRQKQRKQNK